MEASQTGRWSHFASLGCVLRQVDLLSCQCDVLIWSNGEKAAKRSSAE